MPLTTSTICSLSAAGSTCSVRAGLRPHDPLEPRIGTSGKIDRLIRGRALHVGQTLNTILPARLIQFGLLTTSSQTAAATLLADQRGTTLTAPAMFFPPALPWNPQW